METRCLVGIGLVLLGCGGGTPQGGTPQGATPHGVRVFAPRCGNEADLQPHLEGQMRFLDRTLDSAGIELERLDMPTTSTFLKRIERAKPAWFLMLYTGHGLRKDNSSSRICLGADHALVGKCASPSRDAGQISVDECVLDSLPTNLSGATLVIDACLSAQVDPRRARVPTSIISSSPYPVDATSLFGDRLALALEDAKQDPNCDGLVTDQELFDALIGNVYSEVAIAENRSYPKLRRNARSHIPLPIEPARRKECDEVHGEMTRLVRDNASRWGDLGRALRAQLALKPLEAKKQELPRARCSDRGNADGEDYFVIDPKAEAQKELRAAAEGAGLCEFPESDPVIAEKVARFAIFAEIFQLSDRCGWVRVTRLRDRHLLTMMPTAEMSRAMPRRRSLSARRVVPGTAERDKTSCQFRYLGTAPASLDTPVHCAEPDGQCFLEECPASAGSP